MTKFKNYFGEWVRVLNEKALTEVMHNLFSKKDYLCPAFTDIFKAFQLCPYDKLKVVMIGQDPYPQAGVATGILFGNKSEVREENLSPSLKIVKEACIDYEVPHNSIIFDQTLESWAEQGILLINSALTTEVNNVGSHVMIWRPILSEFLKKLSVDKPGMVYVLFGEQAKTLKPYINAKLNYIFTEKHPAYYARQNSRMPSTVFYEVNKIMKDLYGETLEFFKEVI